MRVDVWLMSNERVTLVVPETITMADFYRLLKTLHHERIRRWRVL